MKTFKLYFIALALAIPAMGLNAQQSFNRIFSQYMDNQTPYNPAYSLLDKAGSVNIQYRKQWEGVDGAPGTVMATGNMPLEKIGASTGVICSYDEIGIEKRTEVNAYFAKSIHLASDHFLAVSLNAGLTSYKADYTSASDADPLFSDNETETSGNVGAGILYFRPEKYYLGASMPRLSLKNQTNDEGKAHNYKNYYISGGALFNAGKNLKIKPAFVFLDEEDLDAIADVSATFYLKNMLGAGIGYRTSKDLSFNLSYIHKNSLKIAYTFQAGVGSNRINNGSHEISLAYRFGKGLTPKLL